MGSAFMLGTELVKLATRHGWNLKPHAGGEHPYLLERPGATRPIPIRHKLKSRTEVIVILKQLGIPRRLAGCREMRWSMKTLFAPYNLEHDEETRMPVLSALARNKELLAVVSEPTLEAAEAELISLLLTVLDAQAQDGIDPFTDLVEVSPKKGGYVAFLPSQLVPIHLKLARSQAKLRQADMADRLGITQQAYAKLERPGANPTLQTLMQLERVLGRELVAWAR